MATRAVEANLMGLVSAPERGGLFCALATTNLRSTRTRGYSRGQSCTWARCLRGGLRWPPNENGNLSLEEEGLEFINPEEPVPLDANVAGDEGEARRPIVDTIEEPRDPIEELELRDAFSRAGADLPER